MRSLRPRASVADESGGEEIIYKPPVPREQHPPPTSESITQETPKRPPALDPPIPTSGSWPSSEGSAPSVSTPPSSFGSHHKAKKRTSEEFERDQSGSLVSKITGLSLSGASDREREERVVRKHRSLGVGAPGQAKDKVKERRRGDSVALNMSPSGVTKSLPSGSRHSRQSSTSSTQEARRVFTDFSHLPPSPSTSTIPSFLRSSGSLTGPSMTASHSDGDVRRGQHTHHASPSMAHSLLRGTQEGWSGLDDTATAEALRKLDGIGMQGKSLRARSSVGSGGLGGSGSRNNSRPGTPSAKGGVGEWEGLDAVVSGREKARESITTNTRGASVSVPPRADDDVLSEAGDYVVPGGDDYLVSSPATHPSTKKLNGV